MYDPDHRKYICIFPFRVLAHLREKSMNSEYVTTYDFERRKKKVTYFFFDCSIFTEKVLFLIQQSVLKHNNSRIKATMSALHGVL